MERELSIVDICKQNAYLFTLEVCKVKEGNTFPEYIDWADHIAKNDLQGYQYHLNKIVSDLQKLVNIFKSYMPEQNYTEWKEEWYHITIAAAWIHDIGMIDDRDEHGKRSAELILKNDDHRFNFDKIDMVDRIRIAILCIKHHRKWNFVFGAMKEILPGAYLSTFHSFFNDIDNGISSWPLELSAKLISAADSLRYRGHGLRNNLGHSFFLCSQCNNCKRIYDYQTSTCKCKCEKFNTKSLFHHLVNHSKDTDKFDIYEQYTHESYKKIDRKTPITNELNIRVLVRDDYQIFTTGDLLLSHVEIMDYRSWSNELETKKIKTDDIFDDISDDFKTVYRLTLDAENPEPALFTFSKYIASFLLENLVIGEDSDIPFTNYTILHIQVSDGTSFIDYCNRLEKKDVMQNINRSFRKWNKRLDMIIPLEIIEKSLKKINITKERDV